LFKYSGLDYLVISGGNRSGEPICRSFDEAFDSLKGYVDYFLYHDREIHNRCDDSVVFVLGGEMIHTRSARGVIPKAFDMINVKKSILGVGDRLNGSFSLYKGGKIYPSQYIGDLRNKRNSDFCRESYNNFCSWLDFKPDIVVCDFHPDYYTTQFASGQDCPSYSLQHHFAHSYAVIVEKNLDPHKKYLCISLDGGGYGTDNNIWGGEILSIHGTEMKRLAHNRYVRYPGAMASSDIVRMALSYIMEDHDELSPRYRRIFDNIPDLFIDELKSSGDIYTSSMGSLFDAVAYLLGICDVSSYDGQAHHELEALVTDEHLSFDYDIDEDQSPMIIDLIPALTELVEERIDGNDIAVLSTIFQNTVVNAYCEAIEMLREENDVDSILLSGDVFQSRYILGGFKKQLIAMGFNIYHNSIIPMNDQSISLGQVLYGVLLSE